MRARIVLSVLALSVLALLGVAAPARAQVPELKGFDHAAHAAGMQRRGKTLECAACHQIGAGGKLARFPTKKHQPCADAGCHAPWPLPPKTKAEFDTYCAICHRVDPAGKMDKKAFYPPFSVKPEHAVPFPHARHAIPGATGKLCASCHPNHGEPAGTPSLTGADAHETCSGCHERGVAPQMNQCAGCHKDAAATPRLQGLPRDAYAVQKRFAHDAHARRVGSDDGRKCSACHDSLQTARDGQPIPRPRMETCGKCHDGKQKAPGGDRTVFAVTGTSCSRCHALDPAQAPPPPAPPASPPRYSHAQHAAKGVNQAACAACHTLDARAMPMAPTVGKDHAPCADAGCHAKEFFSREPKICAGCHADARPWVSAKVQLAPRASEFGRDFSHKSHVKGLGEGGGANAFCQRCHPGRLQQNAAPAQSHATCAPCHVAEAAPKMTDCAGCHGLGTPSGALAARDPGYVWYVRDKFQHDDHDDDPRSGKPTPCLLCHDQVVQATRLAEIGRPKMPQCDGCHDGKTSFKTTGFGCAKCHGPTVK